MESRSSTNSLTTLACRHQVMRYIRGLWSASRQRATDDLKITTSRPRISPLHQEQELTQVDKGSSESAVQECSLCAVYQCISPLQFVSRNLSRITITADGQIASTHCLVSVARTGDRCWAGSACVSEHSLLLVAARRITQPHPPNAFCVPYLVWA
ncbi:hypothetical protein F4860DRAFT_116588 [Xylaria cubensis]|nr:hypothetical protein F4860DRAFT_116588 [Xylaria cubensis]